MATLAARLAPARMNLWRLEWLRRIRTPRALALGAVFVFFGLLEPVLTRYQSQIFRHVGNGVRISFPPATLAAGASGYTGELSGTGLIVVIVVVAGAFTFDTRHGLATFLRTRIASFWQLLAPRFTINAAAAATGYLLGTLGTVGIALAALFLLPIAGAYRPISNWVPSALASAPADLLNGTHHLSHYRPAFAVTAVVSGAALAIAVRRLRLREI